MDKDIEQDIQLHSVRIDKYEFEPKQSVVSSFGIQIIAPDTDRSDENIVLKIPEDEVNKIYCYRCTEFVVLLISVTDNCLMNIQDSVHLDDLISCPGDNNCIVVQSFKISETMKLLEPIFSSKMIDLDENDYVDAMDRFYERSDPEILIYPPPHKAPNGIRINRNDYKHLSVEWAINDVLVDFYLKYLHEEKLTDVQRDRIYVFSQYFYTRLAARNHDHVARWTRNVNIFDKEFIIIPILIEKQWILSIICFPNGSLAKKIAERPCILFFDSLFTDPWDDVATTIRNYLSSEYRVKYGTEREFNRENMPDHVVEVPQQDNVYDSGLFVLQYAETFFKHPLTDYRSLSILNRQLGNNWFKKMDIRMKREDISILISELVHLYNPKKLPLPRIKLPAINREYLKQLETTEIPTVDLCDEDMDEESEDQEQIEDDEQIEEEEQNEDEEELEEEEQLEDEEQIEEEEQMEDEEIIEMDEEIEEDEEIEMDENDNTADDEEIPTIYIGDEND